MVYSLAGAYTLLLMIFSSGCYGFQWTSDLPNGTVKYACVGGVLVLPWDFITSPGDDVLSIQWLFEGRSQEMIGFFSHGNFAPMASYSNRVQHGTGAGLTLSPLTTGDTGNYSVEISGHDASGISFTHRHTVIVQVMENDKLMTTDGQLHAVLQPDAVYSNTTDQWSLVLSCGNFTYLGDPPFDMEWLIPSTVVPLNSSVGYNDGYFNLHVTSGGDYTCKIPQHAAADVCLHNSTGYATVHVDKMEARMTLMEARTTLMEARTTQAEARQEQLQTENKGKTGTVVLYPSSQGVTHLYIDGRTQEVKRHNQYITFSQQFSSRPWVSVSLAEIDSDLNRNLRVVSGASSVSASGFNVYAYQWGDTVVTKVMCSWIACNKN